MAGLIIGLSMLVGCSSGPAVTSTDRWIARAGGSCDAGGERLAIIAKRFATVLDRPVRLHVLNRPELRAYSFPSGDVIVTRGLVDVLTDDELTAVVGHEVGHMLRDGHATCSALTGRSSHADVESAADDIAVRLLAVLELPSTSMRQALQKVHDSMSAEPGMQRMLAARIQRLP